MKIKIQNPKIKIMLLSIFYLLVIPNPAFAHKVNIFAYVEGDMVYTESYFPDGTKVDGGIIEVYDSQGNKLLEGSTNKRGEFNFKPPKRDDLKIVINASMGHKNSYTLSKDELPQVLAGQSLQEKDISQVNLDQIKRIIDTSLDKRLKPIMRELKKAQQKKVSFTEVISGIGYIFGIMGIILYFLSKREKNK